MAPTHAERNSTRRRATLRAGAILVVVVFAIGVSGYAGLTSAASQGAGDGTGPNQITEERTAFPPIAEQSVVALISGGIVALVALVVLEVRNTSDANDPQKSKTFQQETAWKSDSDADQIEQMLVTNGGYMKQARIVEQTDWSKAKVSRLLTRMAENDRIRKDKNGRENTIILKQH